MRLLLTLFFALTFTCGTAQKIGAWYRTVSEENKPIHYLIFLDSKNCRLAVPARNHADAMVRQKRDFHLTYTKKDDTIYFSATEPVENDSLIQRFLDSRFTTNTQNKLHDFVSDYTYIDKNLVKDRYTIYAIEGEVFKQRAAVVDGYGLVRKDYKMSRRLRKRLSEVKSDDYSMSILRGKPAYKKYGLIGLNGVIEFVRKK
ncbi:hypothetical protein [Sabulibacter ruber]|uniref:hypothetical protein n=1 Tax=Sabulibacter ruber TaxID=2811901 RepID=UPI001A95C013|nr:hypothetical protein [Sabulibacter ruber]